MDNKVSFWASPKWSGIGAIGTLVGLALTAIALWVSVHQANPKDSTGTLSIQRFIASSILPPEYFPNADQRPVRLSMGGLSALPGHLQLRTYLVQNLSGRHLTTADFDTPITVRALGGRKFVEVDVVPPANRPQIHVKVTGDTAVIPPMLLNVGEVALIKVLLETPDVVPLLADPYANDDGVLAWTAQIKGFDLSVTGVDRSQTSWLNANPAGIFVIHLGNAVIAIVAISVLLSLLQLGAMAWRLGKISLSFARSVEISLRIALAWAAAEVLVSFADTQLSTHFWLNWVCLAVYGALLLPFHLLFRRKVVHNPSPQNPAAQ